MLKFFLINYFTHGIFKFQSKLILTRVWGSGGGGGYSGSRVTGTIEGGGGGGAHSGSQVTGTSEWEQKSTPPPQKKKNPEGFKQNPPKIVDQN